MSIVRVGFQEVAQCTQRGCRIFGKNQAKRPDNRCYLCHWGYDGTPPPPPIPSQKTPPGTVRETAEIKVGDVVKIYRERLNWDRGTLALRSGLLPSTVREIEDHVMKPNGPQERAIASAIGLTISQFRDAVRTGVCDLPWDEFKR